MQENLGGLSMIFLKKKEEEKSERQMVRYLNVYYFFELNVILSKYCNKYYNISLKSTFPSFVGFLIIKTTAH